MNKTPNLSLPVMAAGEENTTDFQCWQESVNKDDGLSAFNIIDNAVAAAQRTADEAVVLASTINWSNIQDKPHEFPSAPHTHTATEVEARPNTWIPTAFEIITSDGSNVDVALKERVKGPVVDDLTTGGKAAALSAEQGKVLDGKKVNGAYRIYNSLYELGITAGTETLQGILDAMGNSSMLVYATNTGNNVSIYPPERDGIVTVWRGNQNRYTFLFTCNIGLGAYISSFDDRIPGPSAWTRLAIATPPAKLSLPLLDGYVDTISAPSVLTKTQDNTVTAYARVNTEKKIGPGTPIATLPEGYRPAEIACAPAIIVKDGAWAHPAEIVFRPNGAVTINGIGVPAFSGTILIDGGRSFVAASV